MFLPPTLPPNPVDWNNPRVPKPDLSLVESMKCMASDQKVIALAKEHGLDINTVSWEDTGRTKGSCWGPNISDMTLQVRDEKGVYHRMPVIRQPNFADKTHDVAIDAFSIKVGNEKGVETLTKMTLRQYLEGISEYVTDGTFKGPMLCDRDAQVIHSVQTCFLPAEEGKDVRFNVALFNYQSTKENPAVLTIVASNLGASAQIIDNGGNYQGQKLMLNKKGEACDFKATRLKDDRQQAGAVVEGAMSDQEDENTRLYIIQIPLKVPPREFHGFPECAMACMAMPASYGGVRTKSLNMDYAQIKAGEVMGPFHGLNKLTVERDTQFPIRVTEQLYKIVNSPEIGREQMDIVAADVKKAEEKGKNGSSLVLENTKRPTEWVKV